VTTQTEPPAPQARKAGKQGAHKISLRWHSEALTVSTEGYKKIEALMKEYATCKRCEEYYSEEAPNVAENLCLRCFFHWSGNNTGLTYVGPGTTREDGIPQYIFLNNQGIVYISSPGASRSEDAREDFIETLKYWSFPVPTHLERNGQRIETRSAFWAIQGEPRKGVIIAHVWDTYPDKAEAFFLLSKTGKITQINKRKASHRQLFTEARKRLEATQTNGKYYIAGESYNYICEWHEYRMIAHMLDADASLWP
jgi:hypothetical protein